MTQSWRPDEWADDEAWRGDRHCDAEPWRAGPSDDRWRGQEHIADWPEAQAGPEQWMSKRAEEDARPFSREGGQAANQDATCPPGSLACTPWPRSLPFSSCRSSTHRRAIHLATRPS